jgi:hypothetical protein
MLWHLNYYSKWPQACACAVRTAKLTFYFLKITDNSLGANIFSGPSNKRDLYILPISDPMISMMHHPILTFIYIHIYNDSQCQFYINDNSNRSKFIFEKVSLTQFIFMKK